MSTNAYKPGRETFTLPEGLISRFKSRNDGTGFAYEIFDWTKDGRLSEVIVAFRGTEGIGDWLFGNALGLQNRRGVAVVQTVFDQLDASGQGSVPVKVTGHSLGGGIAHHASLREYSPGPDGKPRTVAASYVFNNSPRYWRGPAQVPRIAVAEYGEFLKVFRAPGIEANQQYLSVNCRPGFGPIRDHHMRYLAECLTWIAAFKRHDALMSVNANHIDKPPNQQSDDRPRPTD